jgi:hypothetical protein
MFRVYIEDGLAPIWALDTGPGTAQRRFDQIVWYAVGVTNYNLDADNKTEPKFWLEFPSAELKIINTTAILR